MSVEEAIERGLRPFADAFQGDELGPVVRLFMSAAGTVLEGAPDHDVEAVAGETGRKAMSKHEIGAFTDGRHAAMFARKVFVSLVGKMGRLGSAPQSEAGGYQQQRGGGYGGARAGGGYCAACGSDNGRHDRDCPIDTDRRERLAEAIQLRREVAEMKRTCAPFFADPERNARVCAIAAWRDSLWQIPRPNWALYGAKSPEAYMKSRRKECGLDPLPEVPEAIRPPADFGADAPDTLDDARGEIREGDPTPLAGVVAAVAVGAVLVDSFELDVRYDDDVMPWDDPGLAP